MVSMFTPSSNSSITMETLFCVVEVTVLMRSIVGEAHIQPVGQHKAAQGFDMGGAHAVVDVEAVGLIAHDVGLGAQCVKDALGNGPGAAVGAVQSHALALLTELLAPVLEKLGIPPEAAALLLIRPVSGSGALAVGSELMAAHGPDSYIGRCAAVMLGCTETTFYTIAVYFGAAGIRRTRYTIPAALTADLAGFMAAAWSVRLFFGT